MNLTIWFNYNLNIIHNINLYGKSKNNNYVWWKWDSSMASFTKVIAKTVSETNR
uniref:Uncharacterized protein n=1 Tax=viral metagenome TaxID=1070528 RepID=A0A6C0C5H9_9ZZZZ